MRKTEYKSKYKELVRAGNDKEAQKMLDKYRATGSWEGVKISSPNKKKVKSNEITLDSLFKVDGIGPKTVKDIKRIYGSIDELSSAINADKVPLRDDIVDKLKTYLNLEVTL